MKQNDYLEKLFETQIVLSSDVAGAHTPCLNGREALHRANAAFEGDGGGGGTTQWCPQLGYSGDCCVHAFQQFLFEEV